MLVYNACIHTRTCVCVCERERVGVSDCVHVCKCARRPVLPQCLRTGANPSLESVNSFTMQKFSAFYISVEI